MVKRYKYNSNVLLSKHFTVQDFKCKCGGKHDILIDTDLVDLLEKLFTKLNANSVHITSGYRCKKHDIKVGGSGKGSHTEGKAGDVYYTKDKKRIPSAFICTILENMKDYYGIGYRCGGSLNSRGTTHIDVRHRQWYGNEAVSFKKAVCKTWYKYFKAIHFITNTTMNIRKGAGTKYEIVGKYTKGSSFIAKEIKWSGKDAWLKTNIGYVCLCQKDKYYCDLEKVEV